MRGLFEKAEIDRRDTQRQNIITTFNMAGSSISQMLMNPKFLAKSGYLFFMAFGAFHLTKLIIAMFTGLLLSRFGKPTLARETSKIYTNNYFAVPYVWCKKFYLQHKKRTEKDFFDGVILENKL